MELLQPVYSRLERFVLAMVRNRETAKDIIHETVGIAYQQFDNIRHKEAFLSYLFTIAVRVNKQYSAYTRRTAETDEDFWDYMASGGASPEATADYRALYEALDRLPEQQREAVIMFELLGFSMKEIQKVQGGTLVSVKVRISRARKKLAQILGVNSDGRQPSPAGLFRSDSIAV